MCKCEKGEGLRSGRSEGAPTNLEMVGPKDLGEPQEDYGNEKEGWSCLPSRVILQKCCLHKQCMGIYSFQSPYNPNPHEGKQA